MTRSFGALLFAFVAACGGGTKKAPTTPGTGSAKTDQSQSMKDNGDPTGAGVPTTTTGTPATPTTGNTPASPNAGGPTATTGGPDLSAPPPVVPPNLDPDPAQAKQQVDMHLGLAKRALQQQIPDGELALKEARLALAADPASVDAAAMVAFAYYHKKLYDTAELVLDDVFRRDAAKKNAQIYYVYGLVYDKTNRPERAVLAFKQATDLDPNFASALVDLGMYQLKNSQYAAAQTTFEKVTKQLNRVDPITMTSLGSAYRGRAAEFPKGNSERDQYVRNAKEAYERAIQLSGNTYGPAYYNLGLLYLETDPFPGLADPVARLNEAKAQFDKYAKTPGFDTKLVDARNKDITRAIKKAQQKKPAKPAKTP